MNYTTWYPRRQTHHNHHCENIQAREKDVDTTAISEQGMQPKSAVPLPRYQPVQTTSLLLHRKGVHNQSIEAPSEILHVIDVIYFQH
jgi:hypothetical protein